MELRTYVESGPFMPSMATEREAPPGEAITSILSPRERDVLSLVVSGATNSDIARDLFISPSTANRHVDAILKKVGVRNRVSLAAVYYGGTPYRPARRVPHYIPHHGVAG